MRKYISFCNLVIITIILFSVSDIIYGKTKSNNDIIYLSPAPGSDFVQSETNIIITFKDFIKSNSISEQNFRIKGTLSGIHSFKIIKTKDSKTYILKPDNEFVNFESVEVEILKGITSSNGIKITESNFSFKIKNNIKSNPNSIPLFTKYKNAGSKTELREYENPPFCYDSLPPDFPQINVLRKYDTAPGHIFISNFRFDPIPNTPFLMVLDNSGYPILHKRMNSGCADFKVQNNNVFTYFNFYSGKFYSTDISFKIIDSFYCGNGYSTDIHELLLFPNNHAYLMSYDSQYVNMSQIVEGGDTAAVVSGLIIQEIDENKNVIFQWRSWDHFLITDAMHQNLSAKSIDYVHGNAIDIDDDGNVLISSRHLDEITKINRQTGQIIWRLGGKNNQFNFINDPGKFYYQHCIRKLKNGNYLLFDNGNFHYPPYSRAVEYKLDEAKKTATLVWQYRNTPDIFAGAMGSVQRLPNGNTLIGWGSTNPSVAEVRANGVKIFEMTLPTGNFSYRAFRHTWESMPPIVLPEKFALYQNFPNPFNPMTTIKYELKENSFVSLKLYDVIGREVKILISGEQETGTYLFDFNSENLSSGVYFYKFTANNFTETKKMILVK